MAVVKDVAPRARASSLRGRVDATLKGAAGIGVIIIGWEVLRALGILPSAWAPSIVAIAEAWFDGVITGGWVEPLTPTITAWLAGLALATIAGVLWGAASGAVWWVWAGSDVVVKFLRTIPPIALLPVAVLALGIGVEMAVFLAFFASVWPVLFNTLYAYREIPQQYLDTARSLGLSRGETFRRVAGRAVLPGVITGVRVAAAISLVVTVSAELVVGMSGLGGFILQSRSVGNVSAAYAGIVMGGLLGVVFNALLGVLSRRLLSWSPDYRTESR